MAIVDDSDGTPRPPAGEPDRPARNELDGLWDWNLKTNRIHYSPRWSSMLGCEPQETGNAPEEWFNRVHPDDVDRVRADIGALTGGDARRFENQHRLRHRDETYRWMMCRGVVADADDGRPVRITGSHSDITAEKVADALTGLPNRVLLLDRLSRSIARARRHSGFLYAVLLLDIDRFKTHVERMGPAGADQVLIAAARRLERSLRGGDTVARFGQDHVIARMGGDEFVILLEGLNEVGDAPFVAERLVKELATAFTIGGREVFLTASVGIALSVTGYDSPEQALRDAGTALHRAKSLGRSRCEVFDTAGLDSARSRVELEADLRDGMERQEFAVVYEPIVSASAGQVAGFEALLRWKHHDRGMVSPTEFIPIAERTGLIVPMGRWILREACRQLKAWQDTLEISRDLFVSVNLSATQFRQHTLLDDVTEALSWSGLAPRCLMLELTESAVMENPQAVSGLLMQLRVIGVRISIDDFGTGYSSLSYLRQFPVDVLKIDRSFVGRSEGSKDLAEIVRTVSGLARQLGLQVVAEGIENAEQLDLIRTLSCEYGQGYFFSKPLDSEQAGALLQSGLAVRPPAGVEDASQPSPHPPAVDDAVHDLPPMAAPPKSATWRTRRLAVASACVAVLLAGGYLLLPRGAGPVAPTSTPVVQTTAADSPTSRVEQPAPLPPGTKAPGAPADNATGLAPAAPGESASARTNTTGLRFVVTHQHFMGDCTGTLKVSPNAVSFVPNKGKDGFTLKYSAFAIQESEDSLIMKTGSKTYRFKSASARTGDENRAQIRTIVRQMSRMRQETSPKKR